MHLKEIFMKKNIRREKRSVWAGLCGNVRISGPYFYDKNITGDLYLQMLNESIIPSL